MKQKASEKRYFGIVFDMRRKMPKHFPSILGKVSDFSVGIPRIFIRFAHEYNEEQGSMRYRYKEPKAMREIHKIRERHYKETKHLSAKEIVARTHEIVEKVLRERKLTHLKVGA